MAEPSILGALRDPQFRSDTLRNLVEALNGAKRSLTVGSLGAAGDMGNTLANLVRAAWLGWCFGLGWLASGFWWIYVSLHDFGGLPAMLAALAVLVLAALLALYVAGAMAPDNRARGRRAGRRRERGGS